MDRVFRLDARSLGAARIFLGLLLLIDLAYRAADLTEHYTDEGLLPRALLDYHAFGYTYSIHTWSGSTAFTAALFVLQAFAALFFTIGFRTRLATFVSLFLYGSLVARNPLLHDTQDDLLRVLLFWSLFLPMGRRYAFDRLHFREYGGDAILCVGGGALLVQVALIDLTGAIAKLQSPWWQNGDGIFYALSSGRYQTPFAQVLLEYPRWLPLLNYSALTIELVAPLALFVPRLRRVAIALLISAHVLDAVCLELGIYPFLCAAALAALWPRTEAEDDPVGSPMADALAAAALMLVFLLNIPVVLPNATIPGSATSVGATVGLTQSWPIFAPTELTPVVTHDGWFVVASPKTDPRAFDRPHRIAATLKNHRWRQYFSELRLTYPVTSSHARAVEGSRTEYLRALCTDQPLKLIYLNQLLGEPQAPPKKVELAETACSPP